MDIVNRAITLYEQFAARGRAGTAREGWSALPAQEMLNYNYIGIGYLPSLIRRGHAP
jgi:hypothetical protein